MAIRHARKESLVHAHALIADTHEVGHRRADKVSSRWAGIGLGDILDHGFSRSIDKIAIEIGGMVHVSLEDFIISRRRVVAFAAGRDGRDADQFVALIE